MNWYRQSIQKYTPLNAVQRIDAGTLINDVLNLHYGDLDTAEQEESDLPERIGKHEWYSLKEIPLSRIPYIDSQDSCPFEIREDRVEKLQKMMSQNKSYPPIVVNSEGEVEDGNHRVFALRGLGANTVWAYVPEKEEKLSG